MDLSCFHELTPVSAILRSMTRRVYRLTFAGRRSVSTVQKLQTMSVVVVL